MNQTITHTGAVAGNLKWTVFNAQFTASQNTTSLQFASITDTLGYSGGIMLDAVAVQAVPEPASAALLLLGAALCFPRRRTAALERKG